MANIDSANGFVPYKAPHSGNGQPTITEHVLHASNTAVGIGAPVAVVAGGVNLASAGTGNPMMGIAAEAKAASAGGKIKIWSDPQQLFSAQTNDGTGTATAAAAIGLNINFAGVSKSGNLSTAELNEGSAAAGATLQFKIIELSTEVQGKIINAHGEFNRLVVKINNHQLQGGTGTAGV